VPKVFLGISLMNSKFKFAALTAVELAAVATLAACGGGQTSDIATPADVAGMAATQSVKAEGGGTSTSP